MLSPHAFIAAVLLSAASLHAEVIRIDFGKDDGVNGNPTSSPDAHGNHWNNFAPTTGMVSGMAVGDLVTTENVTTSVGVTVSSGGWMSNGIQNGGLLVPDEELLGEFAVPTATEDYFFVEGPAAAGTLKVTGLDPARLYQLRFFATRATGDIRKTTYRVIAGNGVFNRTLQTSGTGIGAGSSDGNNQTIVTVNEVQPDAAGEVTLQVAVAQGGFAYLGVLEIVRGEAAVPVTPVTAAAVRIDFGRHDGNNGNPTSSPDAFGAYWNNFGGDGTVAAGSSISDLVTTANEPTALGLALTSGTWFANGIHNGGLLAPEPELLGDYAIATATQDYFFLDATATTGTLRITGLNPGKLYNLRFFGTRASGDVRRSRYTVTAANGVFSDTLQTTGTGTGSNGYNGNNDRIVRIDGIQSDTSAQVTVQLAIAGGSHAYLGFMEIVESADVPPIPEAPPASVAKWVEQDALDPVAPGAVLFVGSSSIRRWESLAEDFADYRILQRGFGGSHLSDLNQVAKFIVLPYRPSAIVVWEGTNDISSGKSSEQVFGDYQKFVQLVRAEMPEVPIFYLGVTPTPSNGSVDTQRRALNSLISQAAAADPTLHYIDLPAFFEALDPAALNALYVDNVHINTAGYAEWLRIIRPQLEGVVEPNKIFVPNPAAPVAGDRMLFDFGPAVALDGDPTPSPDARGLHWNHWFPIAGGAGINSGERISNFVDTAGAPLGVRLTITGGFYNNGKRNGGLMAPNGPSETLLDGLAEVTATQDYFYSTADDRVGGGDDDTPGGFMLDGLNPALSYEFRLFGSRDFAETRVTRYRISGAAEHVVSLQTSGPGIGSNGTYAGNDDEIAVVQDVRPDAFGQIFIDLLALEGNFAYINAMEIRVTGATSGISAWQKEFFTAEELADPALEFTVWGTDADPDGDGRSNLLEYATATDPRTPGWDAEQITLEATGDARRVTLRYRKNLAATEVSHLPEVSSNLIEWEQAADELISTSDGIEIRQASAATEGFPQRFLRLRVQVPQTPEL